MSPRLLLCPVAAATPDHVAVPHEDDDVVQDVKGATVVGDLIVGVEAVTFDHRGKGPSLHDLFPAPKSRPTLP